MSPIVTVMSASPPEEVVEKEKVDDLEDNDNLAEETEGELGISPSVFRLNLPVFLITFSSPS